MAFRQLQQMDEMHLTSDVPQMDSVWKLQGTAVLKKGVLVSE